MCSCSEISSSGKNNSVCASYDNTIMWTIDHSEMSDYYIYPFGEKEDWISGTKLIVFKTDGEFIH